MRAKQQHHSGWDRPAGGDAAGGGGGGGGSLSVKSEADESSNQSDMSSVSGDISNQTPVTGGAPPPVSSSLPSALTANSNSVGGGGGGGGGVTPADLNQWMFPKFEPMNPLRKVHNNFISAVGSGGTVAIGNDEDNKENNGGLPEDDMDEPDCLDASTSNINNNNDKEKTDDNGSAESEGQEEENDDGNEDENQPRKRQRTGEAENISPSSTMSALPPGAASRHAVASAGLVSVGSVPGASTSGVNKRKRSQPQRVFEGAQLDKLGTSSSFSVGAGSRSYPAGGSED